MNIVLFGATGMVGTGVLRACLDDPSVERVLSVQRAANPSRHPRVEELVRTDFLDWKDAMDALRGFDACFFCLGVSSAGMTEADYHRVTFDLTIAAASALAEVNPGMTFCYVSGQGTDASERGRMMWARVKGKTENALLRLPLSAYMFRPGYIQPMGGIRSKTALYQAAYTVVAPLFPLLHRLAPNQVTTTEIVGRAMLRVARDGYGKRILEIRDINALGGGEG